MTNRPRMATRRDTLLKVASAVGETVKIEDPRTGWPGIAIVDLPRGPLRVAIHAGPVGRSHRERDDVERRFQNPVTRVRRGKDEGVPVESPPGSTPILLGLWDEEERTVLVGFDAERRIGKTTRFSLFCPLWLLRQASALGWAEHVSTSEERIVAFHPALLPVYLELLMEDARVMPESLTGVLNASGLVDPMPETAAADRARRAASALVRSAAFGKAVVDAYGGLCAMCGLDLCLCEGAHIYPASAPGSPDEIWNGLALCGNHHTAFDRHLVWVEPESRAVKIHPRVTEHSRSSEPSRLFVASTLDVLREPSSAASRPRAEMFARRYRFFDAWYKWAS